MFGPYQLHATSRFGRMDNIFYISPLRRRLHSVGLMHFSNGYVRRTAKATLVQGYSYVMPTDLVGSCKPAWVGEDGRILNCPFQSPLSNSIQLALLTRLLDFRPNYPLSVLVASRLVGQACAKQRVSVPAILGIGMYWRSCSGMSSCHHH